MTNEKQRGGLSEKSSLEMTAKGKREGISDSAQNLMARSAERNAASRLNIRSTSNKSKKTKNRPSVPRYKRIRELFFEPAKELNIAPTS